MKLSISRRKAGLALTAGVLALAGPLALAADAGLGYSASAQGNGHSDVDLSWGCDNARAQLAISGTASLGEVTNDVVVIPASGNFSDDPAIRAQLKKSYTTDLEFAFENTIFVPKSPAKGGAGGNPYIWFNVGDQYWLLGRCHGFNDMTSTRLGLDDVYDMLTDLNLGAVGCSNKGSSLTIGILNQVESIAGRVIFTQQPDLDAAHQADESMSLNVDFNADNAAWSKKGGWKQSGPGGNPFIYVRNTWQDYTGNVRQLARANAFLEDLTSFDASFGSGWEFVGRCSDLKKAR